jgi:hypothetical protein
LHLLLLGWLSSSSGLGFIIGGLIELLEGERERERGEGKNQHHRDHQERWIWING